MVKRTGTSGHDTLDLRAVTDPGYHYAFGDAERFAPTTTGETLTGGSDTLFGSAGADFLIGDVGDVYNGGVVMAGNDTIRGGDGSDWIYGDVGTYAAGGGRSIGGDDKLYGDAGDDVIFGGSGNDLIDGGAGFDVAVYDQPGLIGYDTARVIVDLEKGQYWSDAFGSDTLVGIEAVVGGGGGDWLGGSSRADAFEGRGGDDVIHGYGGDDDLNGGAGNDAVYGGAGNDAIRDSGGNNWLSGGDGNDVITFKSTSTAPEWTAAHGDAGNDTIIGATLTSMGLYGGAGDDLIQYGTAIDTNVPAAGTTATAYITGGAGADRIGPASNAFDAKVATFAQVFDFEVGIDKISLAAVTGASAKSISVLDWGANTGLTITNGSGQTTTMMLMGVKSADLKATDFFVLS